MGAAVGALLASGVVLVHGAGAAPSSTATSGPGNSLEGVSHMPVCAPVPMGIARCHADVVTTPNGRPPKVPPISYDAAQLRAAYGIPAPSDPTPGSGPTVAVVDAYDSPDVAAHLLAYRLAMGLPVCGTSPNESVGCFFTKYDQRGASGPAAAYPIPNTGWAQEIDLDVEMVSAMCPSCRIALVEADSNSLANLAAAVDSAAALPGVVAISNSYGAGEFAGETAYASHYDHPGVAVTVSSGDSGYGVQFPASVPTVVAVGGTSLSSSNGVWTESAWSGAGSGCSAYFGKPQWQVAMITSCVNRMVADVSAVADPNTGVKVFTTGSGGTAWYVFGGTSVAAPIVAGVFAVSGVPATLTDASATYDSTTAHLYDVTTGSNGRCTSGRFAYGVALCTAGTGWDGPTGNGSPRGPFSFPAA